MRTITRRRLVKAAATGTAGALAAPSLALAQGRRWRMVTSWPKRLPGPGMSAERVAERVRTLSGGRLDIAVHAAGEVVPAFEVLDAPFAEDEAAMRSQAERLIALGAGAVLIKGGHSDGPDSVDLLVERHTVIRLPAERIATDNTHCTGCTLSSAVAAGLAKGMALTEAVRAAKSYVTAAIKAADRLEIGAGNGPVHHFHQWW